MILKRLGLSNLRLDIEVLRLVAQYFWSQLLDRENLKLLAEILSLNSTLMGKLI